MTGMPRSEDIAECPNCGRDFFLPKYKDQTHCSPKCWREATAKQRGEPREPTYAERLAAAVARNPEMAARYGVSA